MGGNIPVIGNFFNKNVHEFTGPLCQAVEGELA